ncbi:Spc98 family-domain-containing protein [Neurospora tetraspora]|uniref:Spindle pole body component n=1 Tax=Neurospora tetraspora TaxID=94610 RepID=A0AAE0MMD2_9PEZI|nr:Spc98 family-domain-containing protein [Neurospora tetraspora]
MLHEILLSLSGHPSPLLQQAAATSTTPNDSPLKSALTPPERALLSKLANLSELHINLLSHTARISTSHPSIICRAIATAIRNEHLAAFQRKVLQVEETILKKDAALVGAYNIVPLTAVVGEFDEWNRRMEWLWSFVDLLMKGMKENAESVDQMEWEGSQPHDLTHRPAQKGQSSSATRRREPPVHSGPMVINRLRELIQTGYKDIEEVVKSLVKVAETAWLKQVSAWVLYGRLPDFGADDFFVWREEDEDGEEQFLCVQELLPKFVTRSTAASMLFIGRSLRQIRAKSVEDSSLRGTDHLSTQLTKLSTLSHPIDPATFSNTITEIRQYLSRTTLAQLLPLSDVEKYLQLLRDFFLLRRGEFAMALTQQADEKMRSRWRRAENLSAYEKSRDSGGGAAGGSLGIVVVKEGEVAGVLTRVWQAMGALQGEFQSEEDEGLELARDHVRLTIPKNVTDNSSRVLPTMTPTAAAVAEEIGSLKIAKTPFRNLLFSAPTILTMNIPSPLDLFLSPQDVQTYTAINSYLLSLRRAHLRLTDLWKITSLRRHHPAPPRIGRSRMRVKALRERVEKREKTLRTAWATASAAIFFLGETEAYFQGEVVEGLTDGFEDWLHGGSGNRTSNEKKKDGVDGRRSSASTGLRSRASTGRSLTRGRGRESRLSKRSFGSKRTWDDDVSMGGYDDDGDDDDDVDMVEDEFHAERDLEESDVWLNTAANPPPAPTNSDDPNRQPRDPQTLATAHRVYLRALLRRLLLTLESFTQPLYELLVNIDHLVALMHRLQQVWAAADLEEDVGVVDAFVDLKKEERDLTAQLQTIASKVKNGIMEVVQELKRIETSPFSSSDASDRASGLDEGEEEEDDGADDYLLVDDAPDTVQAGRKRKRGWRAEQEDGKGKIKEAGEYVPRRVGGVDRLLVKLVFGGWFSGGGDQGGGSLDGVMEGDEDGGHGKKGGYSY